LAALPWELLYDARRGQYVCLSVNTPLIRYLELPQPPQPLEVAPPLHILGMIASPSDLPRLDVDREKARVEQALSGLMSRGLVELVWLPGQTRRDLQQAMRRGPWHIFHFVGHGAFDTKTDQSLVMLADDEGKAQSLRAAELGRLLADQRDLRLAVLNACEGAKGGGDIFSSTASILVRQGLPAVLAMQFAITDQAAVELSRVFYESLADGLPVDAAVAEARKAVSLAVSSTVDWATPVLYMRAPDGKLFDVPGIEDTAPMPGTSPYKGLQYFDVGDAPNFFGREALTAELAGYLREKSLLAVVGASGSGKSSLVRAGLIPALQGSQLLADSTQLPKGSAHWPVHVITPTARPLESLAASLTRDSEAVSATATLIDDLAQDPRSLHLYARRLLSKPNAGERLLLVVDQFEELFTLCKDRVQRKAFVDALLTASCPQEDGDCSLAESVVTTVLALRADFYADCAEFDNLRTALESYQRYIGAMSQQELRRAVEEPAQRVGWELEPGLVDVLLQDVGDEPGALPLLSHALLETWKRRRGRTMTLAGYAASGRVQGAIARTADDVYGQRLTLEQQAIARNIFLRLTELGEGAQDTRRRVTLSELVPQDESEEEVALVLRKLADARLVTTYEDEAEVAHEALIREWPTLRGWLEEDREALRVQRRLGEAAWEWESNGRDESYLYRGAQLVQAEELCQSYGGKFSQMEAAFLETSLALRDREAAERERQQQERLEAAEALAEEQQQRAQAERLRAEEQAAAATAMLRRNRFLVVALVVAVTAALSAGIFFAQADTARQAAQAGQAAAQTAATAEASARQTAEDRTTIAEMLLDIQKDFLTQAELQGLSAHELKEQRQRLEQGALVLESGVAPRLRMPEVSGLSYENALAQLESACEPQPCLRLQLRWEPSDQLAAGLVLRSEPQTDEDLLWSTPVTLTVSQGQLLVLEYPVHMEFIRVPAGTFVMGSDTELDPNASSNEAPQHTVKLDEFYISRYEVTHAQYQTFVQASEYDWSAGWNPQGADHPVFQVSWSDAEAFTQWLTAESDMAFRLCTEAEWEKACRGTNALIFPWGNTFDLDRANTTDSRRVGDTTTSVGRYSPAGDSQYGVADMAGNVWEWVADWYGENYYTVSPTENPQGPESGAYRLLRGGGYADYAGRARCTYRLVVSGSSERDHGFRVCVSP
jgi:formylglycine-generating enzyme required for sulfatase activity/energy-coupling factor transporter ATP-binding protein EcfA2